MREWLAELDDLLRGRKTSRELLAEGTGQIRLRPLVLVSVALAIVYGACMGCYAVFNRPDPQAMQVVASGLKVPALFFLTLVVTFPSLYVFSALLGVRLGPLDTLRLVVAPTAVCIAVLASFALITLFFDFCTTSYPFMKLLNVAFFATGGLIGISFMMTMLERLRPVAEAPPIEAPQVAEAAVPQAPRAASLTPVERGLTPWPVPSQQTMAGRVFRVWIVLYALVGAQMAWVLRPFVGAPDQPFTWFRERSANFLVDLARTIADLFG
jgi:hypothetical protein